MLTRLRSFLYATASRLGDLIEATVRDDRSNEGSDLRHYRGRDPATGRTVLRFHESGHLDSFLKAARGYGLDEEARRHVEAGAERLPHHSLPGRDPP